MKTREQFNEYMKRRRAELKAQGICVDCQWARVKPPEPGKRPHVCCEICLEARRSRWKSSAPSMSSIGRLL